MNRLEIDFAHSAISIQRDNQLGDVAVPELQNYRKAILDTAKLPDGDWATLDFDFEARTVRADGILLAKLPPAEEAEKAVYGAFDYGAINMDDVIADIGQFVNGVIDEQELERRLKRNKTTED